MKLKEWLQKEEISQVDFAKLIGVSQYYLSRIINGKNVPSRKLAMWIELYTKKQVIATELLFPNTDTDDIKKCLE